MSAFLSNRLCQQLTKCTGNRYTSSSRSLPLSHPLPVSLSLALLRVPPPRPGSASKHATLIHQSRHRYLSSQPHRSKSQSARPISHRQRVRSDAPSTNLGGAASKAIKNQSITHDTPSLKLIDELRAKEQEFRELRRQGAGRNEVGGGINEDIDTDDEGIDYSVGEFTRRDLSRKKEILLGMRDRAKQREKKRLDQQIRKRERAVRLQQREAERLQQMKQQQAMKKPTNEEIKAEYVILIGEDGIKRGRVLLRDAIRGAETMQGYVVMQMNEPNKPDDPIVAKLVHYGKWKMEQKEKEKERKKSQRLKDMKMIRIMTRIDPHDLQIKCRQMCDLLDDSHPVRLSLIGADRSVAEALLKSIMSGTHGLSEYALHLHGQLQAPLTMDKNFVIINPLTDSQREKLAKQRERQQQQRMEHETSSISSFGPTPTQVTPHKSPTSRSPTPTPNTANPDRKKTPSVAEDVAEAERVQGQRKTQSA